MARTPGAANPSYGFMNWFLNTGRKGLPAAPESAVYFAGNGASSEGQEFEVTERR